MRAPTGLFTGIQCDVPDPAPRSENQAVGLDLGLAHYCVRSDGAPWWKTPGTLHTTGAGSKGLAGRWPERKKGSHRRKRQARALARLRHRRANVRRDFLHKLSTQVARRYTTVCVEERNLRGMTRHPRLSRHIEDAGWGMFVQLLSYTTGVIKANAKHTAQTGHRCGVVDRESRVSRSVFRGTRCGHTAQADVNAAKNILSRGAAVVCEREAVACA